MRRWEDDWQTPTIRRTLRSDALGKKIVKWCKMLHVLFPWDAFGASGTWVGPHVVEGCFRLVAGVTAPHGSDWDTAKTSDQSRHRALQMSKTMNGFSPGDSIWWSYSMADCFSAEWAGSWQQDLALITHCTIFLAHFWTQSCPSIPQWLYFTMFYHLYQLILGRSPWSEQ